MSKLTEAERAAIRERLIALPEPDLTDPDNPEWTEVDFRRAQPPEAFPDFPEALKRGRGRPKSDATEAVSLRINKTVLAAYRATGPGWQSRMNEDLAEGAKRRAVSK